MRGFDWQLATFAQIVTMVSAQLFTFLTLTECRIERKKAYRLTFLFGLMIISITIGRCLLFDVSRSTKWDLVTMTIPAILYGLWISKYRDVRFLVTYCIADVSIAVMNLLAHIVAWSFVYETENLATLLSCISDIGTAAVICILVRGRYRKALELLDKGWLLLMIITTMFYVLLCLMASYPTMIKERREDFLITGLALIMIDTVIVVIIRLIFNMLEVKERQQQEKMMEVQMQEAGNRYNLLKESVEEVRALKHDMKHHLLIIQTMMEENQYEKATNYLRQMETLFLTEIPVYCQNYIVNVLLGYYKGICDRDQIRFRYRADLIDGIPENSMDLVVVLGNAWHNAWEACRECKDAGDEAWIDSNISLYNHNILITIRNRYDGILNQSGEKLYSTKGDGHGIGLESIEKIAELYHGYMKITTTDTEFRLDVVLSLEKVDILQ